MKCPIYQVDAFCEGLFTGNPAAVVFLDRWLDDSRLQAIASENNLSETAFLIESEESWHLRWFTPSAEVALCGHATLGAAHALFQRRQDVGREIVFETRYSGVLKVALESDGYVMRFPAIEPQDASQLIANVAAALGAEPVRCLQGFYSETENDLMAVFNSEDAIRSLVPTASKLAGLGSRGVICTAPGDQVDFVSRCFYPEVGVLEDPVTGSAHCLMTPYWAKETGQQAFEARQLSARGGKLGCQLSGKHVLISGHAVTYLEGVIRVE